MASSTVGEKEQRNRELAKATRDGKNARARALSKPDIGQLRGEIAKIQPKKAKKRKAGKRR